LEEVRGGAEQFDSRWKEGTGDLRKPMTRNHHPTVKPLSLTRYLATLILPPERDTLRRLLVPFCGSASEMIGALQAGWDEVVGIELDPEYVAIAEARLAYWIQEAIQHPLFARQEALCLP
jgi:site-specific DNA-methyltransferase (adenine-specific)